MKSEAGGRRSEVGVGRRCTLSKIANVGNPSDFGPQTSDLQLLLQILKIFPYKTGISAKLFFNTKQLVVFCYPV